jgi:hypothetical protein
MVKSSLPFMIISASIVGITAQYYTTLFESDFRTSNLAPHDGQVRLNPPDDLFLLQPSGECSRLSRCSLPRCSSEGTRIYATLLGIHDERNGVPESLPGRKLLTIIATSVQDSHINGQAPLLTTSRTRTKLLVTILPIARCLTWCESSFLRPPCSPLALSRRHRMTGSHGNARRRTCKFARTLPTWSRRSARRTLTRSTV